MKSFRYVLDEKLRYLSYREGYDTARNALAVHFGRLQVVVNTQVRRMYTSLPVRPYDYVVFVKYSRINTSCVPFLTLNHIGD